MAELIENICVVVEGLSDYRYLGKLSRYFREKNIPLAFKAEQAYGSTVGKIKQAAKKLNKKYKRGKIHVFLDYDKFKREESNIEEYSSCGIKNIFFFEYNYEDFLVSHLSDEENNNWKKICLKTGHYDRPMTSDILEEQIKNIFPGYKKGTVPDKLDPITDIHIENLKSHKTNAREKNIEHAADFICDLIY